MSKEEMDYAEIMNMILNKNKDLPTQKKQEEIKTEPTPPSMISPN
jgi:hypothetical protein